MSRMSLKLLPVSSYVGVNRDDPIRFYAVPGLGRLYRRRVEMCLDELTGGVGESWMWVFGLGSASSTSTRCMRRFTRLT